MTAGAPTTAATATTQEDIIATADIRMGPAATSAAGLREYI
jgi:hypothetical protein